MVTRALALALDSLGKDRENKEYNHIEHTSQNTILNVECFEPQENVLLLVTAVTI